MNRRLLLILVLALGVSIIGLIGCGGGSTTTVQAPPPQTVTETAPQAAPEPAPAPEPEQEPAEPASGQPPNVVGLALPGAKKLLSAAGYTASVKNTDTTFGILVPENYTVCTQGKPRAGTVVPILAQKYGC